MREIEFRAKRIDNNEWCYGFLADTNLICYWGETGDAKQYNDFLIKDETVGQYTGLKDKNGKKIFEGDIVKVFCDCDGWLPHKRYLNGKVCYNQDFFDYEINYDHIRYGYDESLCNQSDNIEVIGNIYDNPELIGE